MIAVLKPKLRHGFDAELINKSNPNNVL